MKRTVQALLLIPPVLLASGCAVAMEARYPWDKQKDKRVEEQTPKKFPTPPPAATPAPSASPTPTPDGGAK